MQGDEDGVTVSLIPRNHATFYKVDISKEGSTLKERRCFRFTLDIRFGTELNIERSFGLLSGD